MRTFIRSCIFGLIVTVLAVSNVAAQMPPGAILQAPWIGYSVGIYPQMLWPVAHAIGDVDGDGKADLVSVSWGGTAYLSVLKGTGDGRFGARTLYPMPTESADLALADFDRDGDLDVAVAETGRFWEGLYVSVWVNDGEGNLVRTNQFLTGDDGPNAITAADFNGDGLPDVAIAHDDYITRDNSVSVLLNNGAGGFSSATVYTIAGGTNEITSGDMDGDGDVDIVVAHEGLNVWSILRNNANGTFTFIGTFAGIQAGSIPEDPVATVADVDRDGDLDVLYSNQDSGGVGQGAIGLWRNQGNLTFSSPQVLSLLTPLDSDTSGGTAISVSDVTGDGWPDILVGNHDSSWFLLPGDGAGGFQAARLYRAGDASPVIDPKVADLDGDGDLDIVVLANGSLEACVYLNPGNGGFIQPIPLPMANPAYAPAFPGKLRAGDLDRDGDLDLLTTFRSDFSGRFGLGLRRNNGDGTFANTVEILEATYPIDLVLNDMDGDGDLDALYLLETGQLILRRNDGNGNFSTRVAGPNFQTGFDYNQLGAADIDGDRDLDAVVDAGMGIKIAWNLGNGTFGSLQYHDVGTWVTAFALGDFNRDGRLDLLTNSGVQGYPEISLGNGNGTFGSPTTVPTGRDVRTFAVGDVNGDGNLDFATDYNLDEKGLGIRRGRGTGAFFPAFTVPGTYYLGDNTGTLDLADLDGDGKLDAVKSSFGGQDVSVWKGNGDGTFQAETRYGVGWNVFDIEVGDFDLDGVLDVAAICQVDNGEWWYPGVVILKGISPTTDVLPTQFTVTRGSLTSGGLADLFFSDDSYLNIEARRPTEIAAASVEIVVEGTSPTASPTSLTFVLEAGQSGDPTRQRIELFNFQTNQWEMLDERNGPFADTVVRVNISSNASRFVQPGTRTMRARIGYHDRGVTFISWGGRFDVTKWQVGG
jgi:hypothetical protein